MHERIESEAGSRSITTSCYYDCGSRCLLKVHVSDGRITRIQADRRPGPNLKPCVRGLAQKEVVYAPDRIKEPLRRVGERGSGRFEPIPWEEAISAISRELQRVKEQHGPESILLMDYSGCMSPLFGGHRSARRFFSLFGGHSTWRGNSSMEAALLSSRATFGTLITGSTPDTFLHSRLILLWAWNPLVTRFGPETFSSLLQAKKAGARIVCVDPRYSPSAKALADEWIPIRPATDTAMLLAMAHVMIQEGLYDHRFIETYTFGFDAFQDHVLGREDGLPRTPKWAERITGVPAGTITDLARAYARMKPAALCASWAPGRTAMGEQYHRAASTLAAMTGNIGIPGGYAAGGTGLIPFGSLGKSLPVPKRATPEVHIVDLFDALLQGKAGGYPRDIQLLYVVGSNFLNQFLNTNKGAEALRRPAFVVVHELFMTPTARYADIVLPVTTHLEREDVAEPWMGGPYFIHMARAIEPLAGAKSDFQIFSELASSLGIADYREKSEGEWLREFVEATQGLPPYEELKEKGVHHIELDRPWVAFREEIRDPEGHPFRTPSGKIEIYSQRLAERNDPRIPPIPKYLDPWEGPEDPLIQSYPLQLVTPHSRARVNSQFDNIPRLKAYAEDEIWLHPRDAEARGIAHGDRVRVYNDRGALVTKANVTDRIMEGVASLDSGAWFDPGPDGLDRGGCVNVLTLDRTSPAGAFPCNSCLVQIERL